MHCSAAERLLGSQRKVSEAIQKGREAQCHSVKLDAALQPSSVVGPFTEARGLTEGSGTKGNKRA